MGLERQIRRNQLKQRRKKAKQAAREIQRLMEAMPDGCSECGASFTPRETPEQLDTWHVNAGVSSAKLTCGDCLAKEGGNDEYWQDSGRTIWEAQRKMEHGKNMIRKWDTRLNQYLFGKDFYKKEKWKGETLSFILFPENIHSNLHFHGVTNVTNTSKYPNKVEKFLEMANEIWYSPPRKSLDVDEDGNKVFDVMKDYEKSDYQKESICPGGQIWIEEIKTDYDLEKIAGYITKQMKYFGNEEGLYLTKDWRA